MTRRPPKAKSKRRDGNGPALPVFLKESGGPPQSTTFTFQAPTTATFGDLYIGIDVLIPNGVVGNPSPSFSSPPLACFVSGKSGVNVGFYEVPVTFTAQGRGYGKPDDKLTLYDRFVGSLELAQQITMWNLVTVRFEFAAQPGAAQPVASVVVTLLGSPYVYAQQLSPRGFPTVVAHQYGGLQSR